MTLKEMENFNVHGPKATELNIAFFESLVPNAALYLHWLVDNLYAVSWKQSTAAIRCSPCPPILISPFYIRHDVTGFKSYLTINCSFVTSTCSYSEILLSLQSELVFI